MATRKWNPDNLQHGLTDSSELCHWGIKGMKWGVRRFQNKDGSLTPAGKKRYSDEDDTQKASGKKMNRERAIKAVQDLERSMLDGPNGYRITKEQHDNEVLRRSKLSESESDAELKKIINGAEDAFVSDAATKMMNGDVRACKNIISARVASTRLFHEINNFSGNWYEGEPKTEAFRKVMNDYDKSYREKIEPLEKAADEARTRARNAFDKVPFKLGYVDSYNGFKNPKNVIEKKLNALAADRRKKWVEYLDAKAKHDADLENDMTRVVLQDLGYRVTPTAQKLIESYVFWD